MDTTDLQRMHVISAPAVPGSDVGTELEDVLKASLAAARAADTSPHHAPSRAGDGRAAEARGRAPQASPQAEDGA